MSSRGSLGEWPRERHRYRHHPWLHCIDKRVIDEVIVDAGNAYVAIESLQVRIRRPLVKRAAK